MSKIRRNFPPAPSSMTMLLLFVVVFLSSTTALLQQTRAQETIDDDAPPFSSSSQYDAPPSSFEGKDSFFPSPRLTSDSVVLITGAAGFLGSELALALRRTYNVRRLLLVDNLGIESENESAFVPGEKTSSSTTTEEIYKKWSEETLSLFEIRRQRIFRIFHELTSPSMAAVDSSSNNNNDGPESVRFYRADIRPSIPEFFDFGEVPLLEGIFAQNPGITHVVHLADVPLTPSWGNQAVPRSKDSVKAGRMEGVLEELRMVASRRGVAEASSSSSEGGNANQPRQSHAVPHFVYASSSEVYDALSSAETAGVVNPPPFREHLPITTPSTLRGASKLMDEILASAYHSAHGIYSVGLRFFDVYGPWSTPGTEVFDLVERVAVDTDSTPEPMYEDNVKDYVFIDDAVDAIMAAMQYRSVEGVPVVFNVGTGKGTTLRQVEEEVSRHFPKVKNNSSFNDGRISTTSIASTARSEALLGFKAQTSLQEGLAHTISWHRDRSLPYGHDPSSTPSLERQSLESALSSSLDTQRTKCSPLDRECLRGSPVFPCASECRRSDRCTPSAWDDVASLSRAVTSGCDAVLYTVMLDEHAEQIPSATLAVGVDSSPYVGAGLPSELGKKTAARCNVAFVSDKSPLVQRLRSEGEVYVEEDSESGLPNLLRHGFWTVLPVSTPKNGNSSPWLHAFSGRYALEYLPKVSPGRFFGSSVRYAAYAAPTVLLDNLPKLLKSMEDNPTSSSGTRKGVTALLVPAYRPTCDPSLRGSSCTWSRPPKNDSLQASVYNTIRVALRGQLLGGSLDPTVDTSFVIHSLEEDDARLFRCDVYAEVAEWGASGDERAVEFIASLHDLWSKAVMHWIGQEAWWDKREKSEVKKGEEGTSNNDGNKGMYLGILSSTDVQLFTRIVPPEGMGIVHLEV